MLLYNLVRYITPPRRGVGKGRRQTFFTARWLRTDFLKMEGRNEQIYLLFSLEAEDLQLEAKDLQLEAEDLHLEAED